MTSTNESKGKGKVKETDIEEGRPVPARLPSSVSIFTDYTSTAPSSPSKLTPNRPFPSASATNLFDGPTSPASPHFKDPYHGGTFPPSPSVSSNRSFATSSGTPKAGKKFFGTRSAPSVRSNHTMPELVALNDVDQWGVGSRAGPRTPTSPKKGSNTPPEVGVRRKNSSSKMLAKGLSRSLTRMGSVMKRSTSGARMGMAGQGTGTEADENAIRKTRNRHSVVHEEMGNEWERVDMQQEVTEGDTSITRPFNVEVSFYNLSSPQS